MNLPFFLARRFYQNINIDSKQASNPTITIATLGVAIGLAVMLITWSVIAGFKLEITNKVEGIGGHIQVMDRLSLSNPDGFPVTADSPFVAAVRKLPEVKRVSRIASKMGVIKTFDDFMSITFRGLSAEYDTTFLSHSLVEGRLPDFKGEQSSEILISTRQAQDLRLKRGDRIYAYFFEESIKTRRFTIVGIYETNMAIFDQNYAFLPVASIDRLNQWEQGEATSLDVRLYRQNELATATQKINAICDKLNSKSEFERRRPLPVTEQYGQVFAWLGLLDFNMLVILTLMVLVSGFTMVSGLFILILERTQTIGVLKALGASNGKVRLTFLYFAAFIVLRGLLVGNALVLVLLFVQQEWGLIHLNPNTYYVDTVPVVFDWLAFLVINLTTLVLTVLALVVPSYMISRIQPSKAIRFE